VKRLVLLCFLAFTAVSTTACPKAPSSIVTPEGKAAYQADLVVARLQELSTAVIDLSDAGAIPVPLARELITWVSGDANATPPTTGIVQAIQVTAGQGWKAAALQSWNTTLRPKLVTNKQLLPWVYVVDSLLQVV
jgi:hypothetical protein